MQRALDLAKLGQGFVAPNPLVGCVIVKNNQIIGEGWHNIFGGLHAEVNAIQSISESNSPNGADVYVTLEPCSHFGKTPPCADLLIASKVKKVYICNEDPNPLVSGKGIQKLLANGIEVESGLLADKGNQVNRHFFTFHRQHRPFITLKFATSKDQFLSQKNGNPIVFSNEMSKTLVHQLRTYHQAILVGVNTANWDNPHLTARYWQGNNPVRIILDPNNRINSDLHVLTDENPTWIFTERISKVEGNKVWFDLQTKNADAFLSFVLQTLYQKNIQSILVEGGAATLQHFLENQFVDEIIQIEHSKEIGEGIAAPSINVQWKEIRKVGDDNLWKYWYRD